MHIQDIYKQKKKKKALKVITVRNISNENCQFCQAKEIMEDNLEPMKDQKIKYDE
jgi:hypothetical protein